MNLRRSFTTIAAASALVAVLMVAGGSQAAAAVICVASDGHVGLERTLDSCCAPSTPVAPTTARNPVVEDAGCAGCTDVAVDASQVLCRAPQPPPPVVLPVRVAAIAASTAPADSGGRPPAGDGRCGCDLQMIAAVVLLT